MMTNTNWLVVGLGNPGKSYQSTRHNIGAMVIEHGVNELGENLKLTKKLNANICETKLGLNKVIFTTLTCYMNESGGPVSAIMNFFKIELDNLIVLHDELDLEYGDIRIKQGGGDNGHNGLKSIRKSLDSGEYIRIRLGIGRPPGEMDPADFVLKPFNFFEKSKLTEFLNMGNKAISDVVNYGVSQAQNLNNG
jgi:PTH1 family peptidyl-tRNA hydrolase